MRKKINALSIAIENKISNSRFLIESVSDLLYSEINSGNEFQHERDKNFEMAL